MRRLGCWHRWLGLILIAPLLIWIATGAFFLVRPGYEAAYADPPVKTYQLTAVPELSPRPEWSELRWLRTVLGDHLLVRTDEGWQQLDPESLTPRPVPGDEDMRRLVADAIAGDPRYGTIETVSGSMIETSTDVRIDLDWQTLSLDQRGPDTRWIAWTYDVHSFEWTGIPPVDRALGGLALALLATSTIIGLRLALQPQ